MTSPRMIDAWMQHPTSAFIAHPMFDSLRRWTGGMQAAQELPLDATLHSMDEAGVELGLLSAWWGPTGPLISNDLVARAVAEHPDRFRGVAAVDLARPIEAVRELRRCAQQEGFIALRFVQWLWNLPPKARDLFLHGNAERLFGLAGT